jgi:hypothetical protein
MDALWAPVWSTGSSSMENLRRIKSVVFFADFLRFKTKVKTTDLSTAVSEDGDCERNRNGD